MYCLRDLLVCGPVVVATSLFGGAGWVASLILALLLYASLRLIAQVSGVEQAVRDRHNAKHAARIARSASRAAGARAEGGGLPKH